MPSSWRAACCRRSRLRTSASFRLPGARFAPLLLPRSDTVRAVEVAEDRPVTVVDRPVARAWRGAGRRGRRLLRDLRLRPALPGHPGPLPGGDHARTRALGLDRRRGRGRGRLEARATACACCRSRSAVSARPAARATSRCAERPSPTAWGSERGGPAATRSASWSTRGCSSRCRMPSTTGPARWSSRRPWGCTRSRRARPLPGERIAVIGAGPIGILAALVARPGRRGRCSSHAIADAPSAPRNSVCGRSRPDESVAAARGRPARCRPGMRGHRLRRRAGSRARWRRWAVSSWSASHPEPLALDPLTADLQGGGHPRRVHLSPRRLPGRDRPAREGGAHAERRADQRRGRARPRRGDVPVASRPGQPADEGTARPPGRRAPSTDTCARSRRSRPRPAA